MNEATPLHAEALTIEFTRGDDTTLTIVDDWELAGGRGEFHCIAGRSGSGKTSVLRAMAGLLTPTEGRVSWWGDDVSSLSASQLRQRRRGRIGYMDQSASLIPELTVRENVLLPLLPDGRRVVAAARPYADELIGRLGLADRTDHVPPALSGGERQRVALARALVNEPDILIADEPTASLDRRIADLVIELMRDLAGAGMAVIVASHDPHVSLEADHVHRLEAPPTTIAT